MATDIIRNNRKIQILGPNGFVDFTGISRKKVDSFLKITFPNGDILKCTDDHKIFYDHQFIEAKNLPFHTEIIKDVQFVYDPINVGDDHLYMVDNIINHNCVEFQGSSGTLIAGWKLKQLQAAIPIHQHDGLSVYENPEKGHTYICIVDVSRGKGLDYSAFSIIDVSSMPYKQACSFRNNLIAPIDYAEVIYRVAKSYNTAAILVEVNDLGEQISTSLHFDFEYENLLFTENAGRSGKKISSGFGNNVDKGIRTTKSVKSVGCSILKLLIEQGQLLINDKQTISELSTFSRKGVSYEAEPGNHDDMVMGLVLFAWLSDQTYFKDITDINTLARLREKTDEEISAELLPFGFVEDGREEESVIDLTPRGNWFFQVEDSNL